MYDLSEDQRAIRDLAEQFADEQMMPHAAEWDESHTLPVDVLREAAALGFAGIYVGEDMGGCGLGRLESTIIFEQLSRACPASAAFLSIHNMASYMIDSFASDELRSRYVPELAAFDKIASYCLTEPGAGSDAASLRTKAVKDGDHYVLTGSKSFISGGGLSDIYVVMARTSDDGARGISCFVVEKTLDGVSFGAQEKKMGWNAQPTSQVNFDGVRVPAANLVGEEGQGFKIAMQGLDGGRLNIAACSLGGAQSCFDRAVDYMNERKQFGQKIAEFQALQFRIADMATKLATSRMMLRGAAAKVDEKVPDANVHAAMAKRFVTDSCFEVANDALQLHGGYGYLKDYQIERYVRDLRVHQILEGTNEIMRVITARHFLK